MPKHEKERIEPFLIDKKYCEVVGAVITITLKCVIKLLIIMLMH